MKYALLFAVAAISMVGIAGCSDKKKNERYDKTHDMRDETVRRQANAPATRPSTRPGQTQLGK